MLEVETTREEAEILESAYRLAADLTTRSASGCRPFYSITYDDEGAEVAVTVSEKGVVAIIATALAARRPREPAPWCAFGARNTAKRREVARVAE